jgi:multidrug efflux pump subunit AcrB
MERPRFAWSSSFVYGTDINAAAVDLEQQIAAARSQLPNDPMLGQPRIVKANPNALPVVQLYISDTKLTQPDLGDLVSNDLANQFSSIAGVAAVDVGGALQRAIMVEPNQMALAASGVTADEIVNRLKQEHVDIPAGIVRIGRDELQIRTSALLRSAAEVGAVPLAFRGGDCCRRRSIVLGRRRESRSACSAPRCSPRARACSIRRCFLRRIHGSFGWR